MKKYCIVAFFCTLLVGCSWYKAIRTSEAINKTLTFRSYEFYSFPEAKYWFFDTEKNKRVYGPHGSLAQIDDNNNYILFAFEAFGYYERTPKFSRENIIGDLKPLILFMEWADMGLSERNTKMDALNQQYKEMGLKYIVVNESGTNEPLLTFKGGNVFGPGGNAYPKESVSAMIAKAMEWSRKLDH